MGNCGSNPKTIEDGEDVPLPTPIVVEEVKIEQQENKVEDENASHESKPEELPVSTQENSEGKVEEPKTEEVKAEAKEAEKEEIKAEINEEKATAEKN